MFCSCIKCFFFDKDMCIDILGSSRQDQIRFQIVLFVKIFFSLYGKNVVLCAGEHFGVCFV